MLIRGKRGLISPVFSPVQREERRSTNTQLPPTAPGSSEHGNAISAGRRAEFCSPEFRSAQGKQHFFTSASPPEHREVQKGQRGAG